VLCLEYVVKTHRQFILGKNKLKFFCFVRNVQDKMPHGTQDNNGCPYPLSNMDVLQRGSWNKIIYLTARSILLLTISALNTDCFKHQNYNKKENAFGHTSIYRTAHTITIFININKHELHKFRYEEPTELLIVDLTTFVMPAATS
jgi:hypothetical protein